MNLHIKSPFRLSLSKPCFCLGPGRAALRQAQCERRSRHIALALAAAISAAPVVAAPDAPAPVLTAPDARDVLSYAQPLVARVAHVDLDLVADFKAHTMSGTAALDVLAKPGAKAIVLDTNKLTILAVTDAAGRPLKWRLGKAEAYKGAPLTIDLAGAKRIVIRYRSSPDAGALQWLPPELTAGKRQPYLFSQGESINNRSWIPTQDSSRHPPELDREDHRSRRPDRGDERRPPHPERRTGPRRRPDLPVRDGPRGAALPDRDRDRRSRLPPARPPHRGLDRAFDAGSRRLRTDRYREDGRDRRGALRPLPVGPLRRAGAPAVLPLRRDGESDAHLRDAHLPDRRPIQRQPDRA